MRDEEGGVERRIRLLLKAVLITPPNYRRILTRIVPEDQRYAVRAGIIISHYTFTTPDGQTGYGIISHTTRRAGVCIASNPTIWGAWSEQTGTITAAGGLVYNRLGELVCDLKEHVRVA
jgi:hypothetical protein